MKFINDVITEKLIVFRKKKIEIVKELLKMNVIQVYNGKCLSEISYDENTNNYDYLIKISLNLFTEEELEKLRVLKLLLYQKLELMQQRVVLLIYLKS